MAAALPWIALGLGAAGTVVQTIAAVKQGRAAERAGQRAQEAANSQAEIQDFNAAVADLQAKDAVERGAEEESRFRTQIRSTIGTQRAAFAASNVDVNYGSAVDVQADAAFLGELDALTLRTNAAREQWGFQVQATDYRKRAEVTRKEGVYLEAAGREQKSAAYWQAGATILGGGASLLQLRYGWGRR